MYDNKLWYSKIALPEEFPNFIIPNTGFLFKRKGLPKFDPSYIQESLDLITNILEKTRTIDIICSHSWKQYQGFTETYDYCVKCDKKRQ
jgi:hypothetical protein